jgi:hypothetical protein
MRVSKANAENAKASSAAANEARRKRVPTVIDWDAAIARCRDMLDEEPGERAG